MSITLGAITAGGITNGGILAGGILASQTESPYRDYSLYLDGTLDRVSGRSLSCLIPGTRYDLVNSVQTSFATNIPVKTEKGIRTVGAYTNYFLNSGSPATQSLTLAAGTYTLSITGTGSAVYNSNTAVAGTPVTFTLASSTTADCTITGSVLTVMLCQKKYAHPYIPTADTAVASVSESGTVVDGEATNGVFADEIASNFATLNSALQDQGTLALDWTPGYSAADVSGTPLNILSFDGITKHLSYDPSAKAIRLTDRTRTLLSPVLNIVANTTYGIKLSYGSDIMQLSVDSGDIAETVFDGSFNPGSDMVVGLNNAELQYINNIKVLKEASHGTAATGLQEYFFDVINSTTVAGVFQTTGSITVYWGDGTSNSYNGVTDQAYSKTYAATGKYTVTVVDKSLIKKFTMVTTGANIKCDTSELPVNLTHFSCTGSNTVTGSISELPVNLTHFSCTGSNTVTGSISELPVNLTYFSCYGSNTVTGSISELPVKLIYFYCTGSNTVTGSISELPVNLIYFYCTGLNTISEYTTKTWSNNMQRVYHVPVSPGGLSSAEVDQLLIDLANVTTWTGDKVVYLKDTNAARTSASDAAVATLQSKGVTVTTN